MASILSEVFHISASLLVNFLDWGFDTNAFFFLYDFLDEALYPVEGSKMRHIAGIRLGFRHSCIL